MSAAIPPARVIGSAGRFRSSASGPPDSSAAACWAWKPPSGGMARGGDGAIGAGVGCGRAGALGLGHVDVGVRGGELRLVGVAVVESPTSVLASTASSRPPARASRRTCAGAGAPRSPERRPRAGRWGTPPASRRGRSGRRAGGTRSRSACPRPPAPARRRCARGHARRGSSPPRRSRPRAGRRTRRPRPRGARAPTRAPRSPRRGRSARRRPGARRRGRARRARSRRRSLRSRAVWGDRSSPPDYLGGRVAKPRACATQARPNTCAHAFRGVGC